MMGQRERQEQVFRVAQKESPSDARPSAGYSIAVCAALFECLGMVGGVAWAISAPDRTGLFYRIATVVGLAVIGATLLAIGLAFAFRARR